MEKVLVAQGFLGERRRNEEVQPCAGCANKNKNKIKNKYKYKDKDKNKA